MLGGTEPATHSAPIRESASAQLINWLMEWKVASEPPNAIPSLFFSRRVLQVRRSRTIALIAPPSCISSVIARFLLRGCANAEVYR